MNLGALAAFAFVASITPGPNNVMLWASGLNFGLRRTLPHMFGIAAGFMTLLLATALGIGALFQEWPWLSPALRIAGSAYLLYLAYRVATAGRTSEKNAGRPFSFFEAAAFQYLNPKAWVMGITAAGTFIPSGAPLVASALLLTAVFAVIAFPCITVWAAGGTAMGRLFDDQKRRRQVNLVLALLLVATVVAINL